MNRYGMWSAVVVSAVAGSLSIAVVAGPTWTEDEDGGGDSGNLPRNAQRTFGEGPLEQIEGGLGNPFRGGQDTEDMFLFRITDPDRFSMRTVNGGFAEFDSQIWLFRVVTRGRGGLDAVGWLANDNVSEEESGSFIGNQSTDESGFRVEEPGLYLVAITRFNNDPFSNNGPIFLQETRTEVSGPDGPGGQAPITGWSGEGFGFEGGGRYGIVLTGASFAFVPAPGALGLLALAPVLARRRRR